GGADDQGIGEILPDLLHRREVGHEIDHDLALGGVREVTHERLSALLVPVPGPFGEPLLRHAGEPLDPVGGCDLVVDPVDLVEVLLELRVGHAAKFLERLGHWPALAYDSPDSLKGHTAAKRAVLAQRHGHADRAESRRLEDVALDGLVLFPAQRGAGSSTGGEAGNTQERLALFEHLPAQLVGDAKARTLLIGAADVDTDGLDLEIDAELLRVLAERVGQDLVVKPDHALAADLQTLALQHVPAARPQRHVLLVSPPTRLFLGGEGVEVRHAPAVWADIDNHPTIVGSIAERGAIRVVPINPLLDGDYVDNGGFIAQEPLGSLLADVVGESFRADARLGDHLVAKLIVAVEHAAAPVVDEPFDIMAQVVAVSLDLSRAPGNRVVLPPRRLVDHPLCDEASPILRAAEGHVGHGPFELIDLAPQVLRLLHEDADPLVDLSDTISRPRGNLHRVRSGRAGLSGLQDTELALGLFGQLIKEGVEFLVDFRVTGLQPGPLAPITVRPPLLRPIALDFLDVEH